MWLEKVIFISVLMIYKAFSYAWLLDSECHDVFADVGKEELKCVWPPSTCKDFMFLRHVSNTMLLLISPPILFLFGIHDGALSWEMKALSPYLEFSYVSMNFFGDTFLAEEAKCYLSIQIHARKMKSRRFRQLEVLEFIYSSQVQLQWTPTFFNGKHLASRIRGRILSHPEGLMQLMQHSFYFPFYYNY
ncbi:hypothetical protein F2Q69_00004315 [Brassica cretica]|uniref:Uncharacterized protein n=1 Tax=Brassica cretica TaxID=69181 RepID=A0A8S9NWJ5_BRACR|nr:hypothetical protein F2Q69_00004315 [Brassica cretica]